MVRDILIPSVCFVASVAALIHFASEFLHERPCKEYGEITGLQTESMYSFGHLPTSLGMITKASCACGESIDLTDYESW